MSEPFFIIRNKHGAVENLLISQMMNQTFITVTSKTTMVSNGCLPIIVNQK